MSFNRKLLWIFILSKILLCNAWHKSNFSINSKLPKSCGVTKRYSPENPFELWATWPWLGLLVFSYEGHNSRCNVVLIHPEAAISSLFCIKHIPEVDLKTSLYVTFSVPGQISFQNVTVSHIDFIGDRYNTAKVIALMKLQRPIIVTASVQPICLWEKNLNYSQQNTGHVAMLIGSDFDNVYNIPELRVYQAPAKILSREHCNKTDNDLYNRAVTPDICFTYLRDPKECHSMGSAFMLPRLAEDGTIVWYLRGLFSFRTYYCNTLAFLPAYDIGLNRAWIESHFKSSTESSCGRRKISHLSLVVLGEEAQRGDWPWHAALFYKNTYRCGATLISPTVLITAAHCLFTNTIYKIPNRELHIALGKHNILINEPGEVKYKVAESIVHSEYNNTNLKNDIALLKLENSIIYTEYIQPACLWDENSIKKDEIYYKVATVVGWGITENRTTSDVLRIAKVPIADDLLCLQSHPTFYNNFLHDNAFCAGNPFDNATNVCNGDSGGGLMIPQGQADLEDSWYIRGIVSVTVPKDGTRICDPTKFTIYTDVAQYLPWIKQYL